MKFISLNKWLDEQVLHGKVPDPSKNPEDKKYGCVMMDTKIDNWEDYHLAGIDEEDVYIKPFDKSYGLEEQPHITVVYGIHEDEIDPETVASVIKANMKPLTVTIDEIDIFEGKEYDVVKYNVPVNDQLKKYRELFLKFPNTQTFPEYHPHMTIAYVKPGMGKKYKRKLREPFEVTFTSGVYSYHDNPDDPEDFTRKVYNLEDGGKKKRVDENVRFERGMEPYEALGIGRKRLMNEIVNRIFNRTKNSIWDEYGYPIPSKKDIEKWVEDEASYSSLEEIAEEDTIDLFNSFEEYWMEENEK